MAYAEVLGVNHYYEWVTESGTAPQGDKPVMVFIHGWGGVWSLLAVDGPIAKFRI